MKLVKDFKITAVTSSHMWILAIKVSEEKARLLACEEQVESFIDYYPVAKLMSETLGIDVPINEKPPVFNPGDTVLFGHHTELQNPTGDGSIVDKIEWSLIEIGQFAGLKEGK